MTRKRFVTLTLVPAIGLLATLALVSIAGAVWFAVMNRTLRSPDYDFVGAYNFLRLLQSGAILLPVLHPRRIINHNSRGNGCILAT